MAFNSQVFLFIFLPALFLIYFPAGKQLRKVVLLAASWIFYVWGEPYFFPLLALSIGMNYVFGMWVGRRHERSQNARSLIYLAILSNLAILFFFKYSYFLASNLNFLMERSGTSLPETLLQSLFIISKRLPLGISFFTFQALSYVLDVYRKVNPPERSLFRLALYLSLFPQLISGPLVRYREVNKQIDDRSARFSDVADGARRFIFGLSKKVLIAGPLERLSASIIASPAQLLSPSVAWLAIITFTLQIYYDFSGYTDMAIGVGRIFGLRLPENFNYPYLSQSITEFWRRWHITLSNWFRDYVYFPLERTHRKSIVDRYANILIVFFLTGLWHGATWNFIFWGLAQGAFIVFERSRFGSWLERVWRPLRHIYALLAIIFSWTLFRFANIETSLNFYRAMFGLAGERAGDPQMFLNTESAVALVVGILFCLPVYPALAQRLQQQADRASGNSLQGLFNVATNALAILLLAASLLFLASTTVNAFIYFRF